MNLHNPAHLHVVGRRQCTPRNHHNTFSSNSCRCCCGCGRCCGFFNDMRMNGGNRKGFWRRHLKPLLALSLVPVSVWDEMLSLLVKLRFRVAVLDIFVTFLIAFRQVKAAAVIFAAAVVIVLVWMRNRRWQVFVALELFVLFIFRTKTLTETTPTGSNTEPQGVPSSSGTSIDCTTAQDFSSGGSCKELGRRLAEDIKVWGQKKDIVDGPALVELVVRSELWLRWTENTARHFDRGALRCVTPSTNRARGTQPQR